MELLLGSDNMARLQGAYVLVCGLGGVGSWAAEACARSGIGHIMLVDFDIVKASNINRQLPATNSTVGQSKAALMTARLKDINPEADITTTEMRLLPDNIKPLLDSHPWSCVIDAIDERAAKLELLRQCVESELFVISSMGAANKLDCSQITTGDLFSTIGCPMARLLRKNLKKHGLTKGITAVYSPELPLLPNTEAMEDSTADTLPGEKRPMGSLVCVTATFGMRCASEAIKHIIDTSALRRRGGSQR